MPLGKVDSEYPGILKGRTGPGAGLAPSGVWAASTAVNSEKKRNRRIVIFAPFGSARGGVLGAGLMRRMSRARRRKNSAGHLLHVARPNREHAEEIFIDHSRFAIEQFVLAEQLGALHRVLDLRKAPYAQRGLDARQFVGHAANRHIVDLLLNFIHDEFRTKPGTEVQEQPVLGGIRRADPISKRISDTGLELQNRLSSLHKVGRNPGGLSFGENRVDHLQDVPSRRMAFRRRPANHHRGQTDMRILKHP